MKSRMRSAVFAATVFTLAACGDGETNDRNQSTGDASSHERVDGSNQTNADASTVADSGTPNLDASSGEVGAPTLSTAQVVEHGTIRLAWQNPGSGCMTIEISRNKDGGAFAVAKTITGVAMETTDQPGHEDGTYCYTLVCKLNGVSSALSNERCATQ